jgi:hypothetical protein
MNPFMRIASMFLLVAAAGCGSSGRGAAWQLGFGSFATDLSVTRVVPRGDYLDATLEGHGLSLEVFAPASEVCARVLAPEGRVDYVERGIAGRLERDDESCDAVGIAGTRVRRARQPRGQSLRSTPIPRAQATFRPLYEDDDLILLRGRFPLTSRIGWSGGGDTIAAVPNEPVCRGALTGNVASMEFRPNGRTSLSLVGPDGLCPITGLIMPSGPPAGSD